MEYLGTYKICPNVNYIEVECYGNSWPEHRETLEQEPILAGCEIEEVRHYDIVITDYLSDSDLDKLQLLVNQK